MKRITAMLRLPALCALCNTVHRQAESLCTNCTLLLPELKAQCYHCALPLPDAKGSVCGRCQVSKPHLSKVAAHFYYASPLDSLLQRYKYQHHLYLAALFSNAMLRNIPDFVTQADALLPVPSHPSRLRERGFSPVAFMTKRLARPLNMPCLYHHCQKIRRTSAQAVLDKHQRSLNVKDSFHCKSLLGKKIVIIDDLMTTGSTLDAVSDSLYKAGCIEVYAWCLARAVGPSYRLPCLVE